MSTLRTCVVSSMICSCRSDVVRRPHVSAFNTSVHTNVYALRRQTQPRRRHADILNEFHAVTHPQQSQLDTFSFRLVFTYVARTLDLGTSIGNTLTLPHTGVCTVSALASVLLRLNHSIVYTQSTQPVKSHSNRLRELNKKEVIFNLSILNSRILLTTGLRNRNGKNVHKCVLVL